MKHDYKTYKRKDKVKDDISKFEKKMKIFIDKSTDNFIRSELISPTYKYENRSHIFFLLLRA